MWTSPERDGNSPTGTEPVPGTRARERLQPLGLAHALLEAAHHALTAADDPTDRAWVADALAGARLVTIAGPLDWTRGADARHRPAPPGRRPVAHGHGRSPPGDRQQPREP
ncbi:hypothetical protein GCM10010259_41500 [Streptomyces daghestanicus]|uniref:Uncharacterized protein n=1 Tax=Streptomyces daghestanicus TaxID=66885 RepID=A0ABQ3Q8G7_9ACTN|nr:hypothetical protein GCM10010259_41500 [Streptomyces daghestanicus]GHI33583.1 hypothetical protein Sdagh_53130 [Streptomyces daghestanicus]